MDTSFKLNLHNSFSALTLEDEVSEKVMASSPAKGGASASEKKEASAPRLQYTTQDIISAVKSTGVFCRRPLCRQIKDCMKAIRAAQKLAESGKGEHVVAGLQNCLRDLAKKLPRDHSYDILRYRVARHLR